VKACTWEAGPERASRSTRDCSMASLPTSADRRGTHCHCRWPFHPKGGRSRCRFLPSRKRSADKARRERRARRLSHAECARAGAGEFLVRCGRRPALREWGLGPQRRVGQRPARVVDLRRRPSNCLLRRSPPTSSRRHRARWELSKACDLGNAASARTCEPHRAGVGPEAHGLKVKPWSKPSASAV